MLALNMNLQRGSLMNFDKNELLKTLQSLPDIVEKYVENIPEELLDRKRSATAWTIREHVYHIADVQEMLYQRLVKIRDEENPVITPYFPDKEDPAAGYKSPKDACKRYREIREKQILLVNQLKESDFNKKAAHKEYEEYSIPIILNHMIFHEYWHMCRLEELWLTRDEYFE